MAVTTEHLAKFGNDRPTGPISRDLRDYPAKKNKIAYLGISYKPTGQQSLPGGLIKK